MQTPCLTGSRHLLPSPPIKKSSLTEYHQNYQNPLSGIPIKWILDPTRLHSGWTERKTWRSINQTESTWLGRKALFPQVKPTKLNGMKGKVAGMLSSLSKPVGATPHHWWRRWRRRRPKPKVWAPARKEKRSNVIIAVSWRKNFNKLSFGTVFGCHHTAPGRSATESVAGWLVGTGRYQARPER